MAVWSEDVSAPAPYVCDGLGPDDDDVDAWVDRVLAAAFAVVVACAVVVVIAQVVMRVRGRG